MVESRIDINHMQYYKTYYMRDGNIMNNNRKPPIVAFIILILNTIGLIYEFNVGQTQAVLMYGMYQGAIKDGQYIRMIISAFLHFGVFHYASNMICLVIYGFSLEKQIGSFKFALIYIIAILGGSILIDYKGGSGIHAGASGAIWGLMAATVVYNIQHSISPAYALRGIIVNLIYSFSANVSWQAHIGGGIAGLIAAYIVSNNNVFLNLNEKQ